MFLTTIIISLERRFDNRVLSSYLPFLTFGQCQGINLLATSIQRSTLSPFRERQNSYGSEIAASSGEYVSSITNIARPGHLLMQGRNRCRHQIDLWKVIYIAELLNCSPLTGGAHGLHGMF